MSLELDKFSAGYRDWQTGQVTMTIPTHGLTGLLGGLLGGLLSEHLGLRAVFWACTAVALLALLAAHRLHGLLHPPRPKESSR